MELDREMEKQKIAQHREAGLGIERDFWRIRIWIK
jgi:hypothetical protein